MTPTKQVDDVSSNSLGVPNLSPFIRRDPKIAISCAPPTIPNKPIQWPQPNRYGNTGSPTMPKFKNTAVKIKKNKKPQDDTILESSMEMETLESGSTTLGPSTPGKSLLEAVQTGNKSALTELLTKKEGGGCEVNTLYGVLQISVLHIAAFRHPEMVQLLLDHGADAKAADKLGRTALHLASTAGHHLCIPALVNKGADVNSEMKVLNANGVHQEEMNLKRKAGDLLTRKRFPSPKVTLPIEETEVKTKGRSASPTFDLTHANIGSDFPPPECWGRTPLHQAVKAGHPECVRELIRAGAKVNLKDERDSSPLLLAGTGVAIDNAGGIARYEDIVAQLVAAGAEVNDVNAVTGASTALHHAAARCSLVATRLLVKNGASVLVRDSSNGSPLHEAAHAGADLVMLELLNAPNAKTLVNSPDHIGCTPLHKAAYTGERECLAILLRHGGDLSARSNSGTTVMDAIFMYIARPAHFLSSILDSCVNTNNVSMLDRNFKVYLDFSVLAPHGIKDQTSVMRGLLGSPNGPGHTLLLRHPILETFLRLKWQRLRIFFFLLIVIYVSFLISLSIYVTLAHVGEDMHVSLKVITTTRKILLGSSLLLLTHVAVQCLLLPTYYFREVETWLIAGCAFSSIAITVACEESYTKEEIAWWAPHATSFVMLLSWSELMLLIGRFPNWGNYALMFYTVLLNVLKVLLTFVCLVTGFAFSFFVQYYQMDVFNRPWRAFVTTMVMMTGEYEYKELFVNSTTADTLTANGMGIHYLPFTSRFIFVSFIILGSIVMMNLMVGLAVSDIQGIRTQGHLRRISKQVEFIDHLETIMSHKLFKILLPQFFTTILTRRRSIDTILELHPSAVEKSKRSPYNLPNRMLESCVELAIRRREMMKEEGEPSPSCEVNGRRLSWYVDEADGVEKRKDGAEKKNKCMEEILLQLADDMRMVKEMLGDSREAEIAREPESMIFPSYFLPTTGQRSSRYSNHLADVVAELQSAHRVYQRTNRASMRDQNNIV